MSAVVKYESDWGSSSDPRRYIAAMNERNNALKPVSGSLAVFASTMPEDMKRRVLVQRKIEKTHQQFAELVDPFILKHTNSVYLLKSQTNESAFDLVVYLDNSTCAAELNARRELLRFEYLDRFGVVIDVFEIRISRGSYKEKHPFAKELESDSKPDASQPPLSEQDQADIEKMTANIENPRLRKSFQDAMAAQKRRNGHSA